MRPFILTLALVTTLASAMAAQSSRAYAPARTPWGDPDLQGAYTNSNESLIPMERPASLTGRTLGSITPEELARLNDGAQPVAHRGG